MDTVSVANESRGAPFRDSNRPLEERVCDLMARLTLEEKVTLLAGAAAFALAPIPRLGIPSLSVTDGPTGVRSNEGRPATIFPVGIAMAATWNPELAFEVGAAIGFITPPFGLNLYVASSVTGISYLTIARAVIPYLVALLLIWIVIACIPQLSTYLPHFAGLGGAIDILGWKYNLGELDVHVSQIGFIGLGAMGLPMASNLARKGFALVVHDIRRAPGEALTALSAATPTVDISTTTPTA